MIAELHNPMTYLFIFLFFVVAGAGWTTGGIIIHTIENMTRRNK